MSKTKIQEATHQPPLSHLLSQFLTAVFLLLVGRKTTICFLKIWWNFLSKIWDRCGYFIFYTPQDSMGLLASICMRIWLKCTKEGDLSDIYLNLKFIKFLYFNLNHLSLLIFEKMKNYLFFWAYNHAYRCESNGSSV